MEGCFEGLEPYAGKLAFTVLLGEGMSIRASSYLTYVAFPRKSDANDSFKGPKIGTKSDKGAGGAETVSG